MIDKTYVTLTKQDKNEILDQLEKQVLPLENIMASIGGNQGGHIIYHIFDATVSIPGKNYRFKGSEKEIDITALDNEKVNEAKLKLEEISNVKLTLQ